MVRKLIVDACDYFVRTFKIDGFRFDLMGISDIETMNTIRRTINQEVKLYGEGWNMTCGLEESRRATMMNCRKLPSFAFFNDYFRDLISGPMDASGLGILTEKNKHKIADVMAGSLSIFDFATQSINYVECHDNYTLADKLKLQNLGVESAYPYIKAVIEAEGIPFLQIGQSFFRDKKGIENSYKSCDSVNRITWSYLDKYQELNAFTRDLILKRNHNQR